MAALPTLRKLPPELAKLRDALGAVLWRARLEQAQARLRTVKRVQSLRGEGCSLADALAQLDQPPSVNTLTRWLQRHEEMGICGLIDRRVGRIQRHDNPQLKTQWGPQKRKPASFIKWAGSKRHTWKFLQPLIPSDYRRYYEPMVGSGVVFFMLKPQRAVLADTNAELINAYHVIRDQPDQLLIALRKHKNTQEDYYRVRGQDPRRLSPVAAAGRFIYLNKTGFNGLYRVNRSGHFNVPYGRLYEARICDEVTLQRVHVALQGVDIRCQDYTVCLRAVKRGDLVYLDPPYLVPKTKQNFNAYQGGGFDHRAHGELAALCRDLDRRGAVVIASNSDTPEVRELYAGFTIERIPLRRLIHHDVTKRDGWSELLIHNR